MAPISSETNFQLILDWEVGGGEKFYEKYCSKPVVPPTELSGITIGIGYDVGAHFSEQFKLDWGPYLPLDVLSRLASTCGKHGDNAKALLPLFKNVRIPWETALDQFLKVTIPAYWSITQTAFQGISKAPPCVQEAILSIVFNRGASFSGPRRIEMRIISELIKVGNYAAIPKQIRAMKRLWPGESHAMEALRDRREDEAKLIEDGLKPIPYAVERVEAALSQKDAS